MFKSKTVFIIGAGASKEIDLPMGEQLKEQIAGKLHIQGSMGRITRGDNHVFDAYSRFSKSKSPSANDSRKYWEACVNIATNMPLSISIDNYIDAHRGNSEIEFCGKLGIAACILEAERGSRLFYDLTKSAERINWKNLKETWYIYLQQLLTEGISKDNIESIFENVTFIIFNYDRCLEHFLSHSISQYYSVELEVAYKLIRSAKIYHPYGVVGNLPWQDRNTGVAFGESLQNVDLISISQQLKTFTERVEEGEQLSSMRLAVQEASKLIFLGFSYGETNLDLIMPEQPANPSTILGTAYGISQADIAVITRKIGEVLRQDARVNSERTILDRSATCVDFFRWYQRSIPS